MSRPTEDDQARLILDDLKKRGFRVCELKPIMFSTYLEGDDNEWVPMDDKRVVRLLAQLLLENP